MRHSHLSNEQILLALSESYNVVAAITKYQVFLTSGIGLPKDDAARSELMTANIKVLEKMRTEIRALEHELENRAFRVRVPLRAAIFQISRGRMDQTKSDLLSIPALL